ncbi:MAG: hypothetical protein WC836_20535 [Desulfobacula sp.]
MDNIFINVSTKGIDSPLDLMPWKFHKNPYVIVVPNNAGKLNLIEAISLFQTISKDLKLSIRKSGGAIN